MREPEMASWGRRLLKNLNLARLYLSMILAYGAMLGIVPKTGRSSEAEATSQAKQPKVTDKSGRSLDIVTANRFHRQLKSLCVVQGISVRYVGDLSRTWDLEGGLETSRDVVRCYMWRVMYAKSKEEIPNVLFEFKVSMEKERNWVISKTINDQLVHIVFMKIPCGLSLDDKLPFEDRAKKEGWTPRTLLSRLKDSFEEKVR